MANHPFWRCRSKYRRMLLCLAGLFLLTQMGNGCSGGHSPNAADRADPGPLRVAVTVEPLRWLAARVGGDAVRPVTVVPPGQNHETWEPAPGHMDTLREAVVYFESGMPFEEPLIARLQGVNPSLESVCLLDAVTARYPAPEPDTGATPQETAEPPAHPGHGHTHEESGDPHGHDHGHEFGDPHFWTDPLAMTAAAERIAETLARKRPELADRFRKNLESLTQELEALHREIAETLAPYRGKPFYVFHPELGWFARRYGLIQRAVEQHGKSPGAQALDLLAREIRENTVRDLFTQPGYPVTEVQALARQLNLRVRDVDLMTDDYPRAMRKLAAMLAESFAGMAPTP